MEFTWLKTCAARKCSFFRAHFWSPGTAYLKYTCPNVYFWCFDVVYFLHMFGAFAMRFLLKSVFFYAFGTCVSPRRIFLRLGHLRLVQVYLFYACVEIGLARLLRVYFLTRTLCIFFGKCIFGLHLWKQKSDFCCKCILAAHVFLRSSVLWIVLR